MVDKIRIITPFCANLKKQIMHVVNNAYKNIYGDRRADVSIQIEKLIR